MDAQNVIRAHRRARGVGGAWLPLQEPDQVRQGPANRVAAEFVDLAFWRDAYEVLLTGTVLTEDEVSPRCASHIVGIFEQSFIVGFDEQLQLS